MSLVFDDGSLVLFQGDSITDAGRLRDLHDDMGRGYALMAAGSIGSRFAEKGIGFLNRGVSGNTLADMTARWDSDCLALKPNWVSVLIGINDAWRWAGGGDKVTTEDYESGYRSLLQQARDKCDARFIICEPFLLSSCAEDYDRYRSDLDPKIQVCRKLALEFDALLVPFDGEFARAACRRDPAYWAPDGVHPTPAAFDLMARCWLQTVGAI